MAFYVRHQGKCGQRTFAPLTNDDPLIYTSEECPACNEWFEIGDVITLVPLGPGPDEEDREKARANRWYNALAIPVHAECAGWDLEQEEQ